MIWRVLKVRKMTWRIPALALACAAMFAATGYQSEMAEWRAQREAKLKREGGWLSVAGLFWLRDGSNRFGKDPDNDIVLPDGASHAGTFELRDGKVTVKMPGDTRELWPDSLDVAKVGRLSLFVIKRSGKYGIRLKDPDSQYRREFHGIEYYPAKEEYKVTASFVADPKKIPILNIQGQTEEMQSPGYAVFRLGGHEYRLRPVLEDPDAKELFYIFRDETSGKETYGAGRFLYSGMPQDGKVPLDFNKAYNPPCAFTPYVTCPLPPAENRLAVKIEAGEKKYGH
jgi:uncharacterized protein (DUF1684 family)